MIVVDSSVLVAVFNREPDAERIVAAIAAASEAVMSAATYLETGIVFDGRKAGEPAELDALLATLGISVVPVDREQANLAREAYRRFGKEQDKRKGLNFGDCFSYALAKSLDAPLLFKGNDFAQTDIAAVPLSPSP